MKIRSLKLRNYRQFYGEQELRFSTDPTRPITVLLGDMGFGKSNLMNAICWAFWGDEPHLSLLHSSDLQAAETFANALALEEAGDAGQVEVEVEVRLEGESGDECIIIRRATARMQPDGTVLLREEPPAMLFESHGSHSTVPQEDVPDQISRIIPRALRHLFLFNGETIHHDVLAGGSLVTAVEHISQVAVVDRAKGHLSALVSKERPHSKDEHDLVALVEQIQSAQESQESAKAGLASVEKQLDDCEARWAEQQKLLGAENAEQISALRAEYGKARDAKTKFDAEARSAREGLHRELVLGGALTAVQEVANDCLGFIEERRMKGELPPPINKKYLELLLSEGNCLCGASLSEGSEARHRIASKLAEFELPEFKRQLDGVEQLIQRIADLDVHSPLQEHAQRLEESGRGANRSRDHMERVERELKQYPEDRVREVGQEMQRIRTLEGRLKTEHARHSKSITDKGNELAGLAKKRENLDQKIARANRSKSRFRLFEEAGRYLSEIRDAHMSEVRRRLGETLKENWGSLILKDEKYDIVIDESYRPALLDHRGQDRTPTRSKGELQTLGYAFTAALTTVSRIQAPFIVDTPLGRISRKPGANIARLLPKLLPGRQLIFLATDREYDSSTREAWSELTGAAYKLHHSDRRTEIVEHAF